jgi:hypothetical protein
MIPSVAVTLLLPVVMEMVVDLCGKMSATFHV